MAITHAYTSTKADPSDSTIIGKTKWNAEHTQTNTMGYNVKDEGALGNGVADDTAAIQACITLAADGGGTVFFPPGNYILTSPLTLRTGVVLQGSGCGSRLTHEGFDYVGATTITQTGTGPVIQFWRASGADITFTGIRDIRLHCNAADTTTGDGIQWGSYHDSGANTAAGSWANTTDPLTVAWNAHGLQENDCVKIQNEWMRVTDATSVNSLVLDRAYLDSSAASHADGQDIYFFQRGISVSQFHAENVVITHAGRDGIHLEQEQMSDPDISVFQYSSFRNVVVGGGWVHTSGAPLRYGIYLKGNISKVSFTQCHVFYGTQGGVCIYPGTDGGIPVQTQFHDCSIELCVMGDIAGHAVDITACEGAHFTDCYFENNGTHANRTTNSHIHINGYYAHHVIVESCRFQNFHIAIWAQRATNVEFRNNRFQWNGSLPAAAGTCFKVDAGVVWLQNNLWDEGTDNDQLTYLTAAAGTTSGQRSWDSAAGYHPDFDVPMRFGVYGSGGHRHLCYGSAAPSGTLAAYVGDICFNSGATAGGTVIGWVCTTAGTPGTWKSISVTIAS